MGHQPLKDPIQIQNAKLNEGQLIIIIDQKWKKEIEGHLSLALHSHFPDYLLAEIAKMSAFIKRGSSPFLNFYLYPWTNFIPFFSSFSSISSDGVPRKWVSYGYRIPGKWHGRKLIISSPIRYSLFVKDTAVKV